MQALNYKLCLHLLECSGITVSMKQLNTSQRAQVIRCICDGNTIRTTVRITGVAKNTMSYLLCEICCVCADWLSGVRDEGEGRGHGAPAGTARIAVGRGGVVQWRCRCWVLSVSADLYFPHRGHWCSIDTLHVILLNSIAGSAVEIVGSILQTRRCLCIRVLIGKRLPRARSGGP